MIGNALKLIVLVTAVTAITAGCATFGTGQAGDAEKIVTLINRGDAEQLTNISVIPFIFEGEVLFKASDVGAVWRNLSVNGFRINYPKYEEAARVDAGTYRIFADTYEMETYFAKHVPAAATLAKVTSKGQVYWLLLGRLTGGSPELLGITGF